LIKMLNLNFQKIELLRIHLSKKKFDKY
jgi:hypothetical protein